MKLVLNDFLCAFSTALDEVEKQLVGVSSGHAQRVALLCTRMGYSLGLSDRQLFDLALAALLHDNALTEFIQKELMAGTEKDHIYLESELGRHCAVGEQNIQVLPNYKRIRNAVLYHHECADGSGPFHKTMQDVPIYARLIHLADRLDVEFDFRTARPEDLPRVREYVRRHTGTVFSQETASVFMAAIDPGDLYALSGDRVTESLRQSIPAYEADLTGKELRGFADMFAKIIDCKSAFTCRHSVGIAEKAERMGAFYGWSQEVCDRLYFAGAMHDVGKLMVDNEILEKPGRLTAEEYRHIQNHAMGTYEIMSGIQGLEEVTAWAAHHHEKLDGTGYPFGHKAAVLGREERLMACLDIYQALVEPRPYKDGLPHETAMGILRKMGQEGQLDTGIIEDINTCFGTDAPLADTSYQAPAPKKEYTDGLERWRCPVCGYIHEGPLPENLICPRCEQPGTIFERV